MAQAGLPERTSTLIIGGGPSGLVSLKYVKEYGPGWEEGEEPVLLEMEDDIGGTFRWRDYENAELVSSKQLTCFSDFRYPLSAPDHPSLPNYVDYLHRYAEHFDLSPQIRLGHQVVRLELDPSSPYRHIATVRSRSPTSGDTPPREWTIRAQRVVITTGLHVEPNIPSIPGLTADPTPASPSWIHSSSYKARKQLAGKKILVLGAGETAMDVGNEAILARAARVWMGVRTGFLSFPKVLNNFRVLGSTFEGNLPIDGLITNLFETTYVHPWVAASHLRWFVSDFVVKRVLWVLTGTQAGCNQWAGELPPERQGRAYVFLNKSAKGMQYINRPYYKLSWLHRLFAHYIEEPIPADVADGDPTIHLTPFPTSFDASGRAVFPPPPKHRSKETGWTQECRPDLVVLCTGYKQSFTWLGAGYPTGPERADVRGICHSADLSVAYVGFLRPGVGAIPPMAEQQIQLWLLLTTGQVPVPTSPETYHLLHTPTGRIQYGVDYSTYMATLARDMGSSPDLWELWRTHGAFVLFIYCFGAAFPTFYRLLGPYKSSTAPGIVKSELWETIKRRGVAGNIFMGVIPMAFYAIVNLLAYTLELFFVLIGRPIEFPTSPSQGTKRIS